MKRSELLFIYDVKWGNPNGDPLDENRPRMDELTDTLIVTDVRLKRTVRDYLKEYLGETLWVSGDPVTPDKRMKQLGIQNKEKAKEEAIERCIDVRLFGAVIPSKGTGALETSLTGPVQFRFGRSLHKVKWQFIQGTAAFSRGEKSEQRSFREEYVVPYVLIAFYGVINDITARSTKLSEEDIIKLIKGMWLGTKNLITRSKMEQNPRLLLKLNYKEGVHYHHGELDYMVKLISEKEDYEIRDVEEFILDFKDLIESLKGIKEKIDSVEYLHDKRLKIAINESIVSDIEEVLTEVTRNVKKIEVE